RISAGKSGNVATSLPARADVLVSCVPANCMPSPESPANRTVASSRRVTFLDVWTAPLIDVAMAVVDGSLSQPKELVISQRANKNKMEAKYMRPERLFDLLRCRTTGETTAVCAMLRGCEANRGVRRW